jgi:membrane fusion protein (multidrug efflux system)
MTFQNNINIKDNWVGRHRRFLMIVVPAALAIGGTAFYFKTARYVSTDDAYVRAARVAISADVSGTVRDVDVHDNQPVRKGEILFRLDDRTFRIAVARDRARLAAARLRLAALTAGYGQSRANLRAARDDLAYRTTEYARQKRLAESGIASQARLDRARQALRAARQTVVARQQAVAAMLARLGGSADIPVNDHPAVQAAAAALAQAELNLSYATVRAPIDGIATKVDQLQPGDYVTKARPVFSVISATDLWVSANFKETDLTHMRPGQAARIVIDAYPDTGLRGRVASVSPGTGASFSVLPPENASGNWVKVVQRLPVRISIADRRRLSLHDGLSATVRIDTRYRPSLFGWL